MDSVNFNVVTPQTAFMGKKEKQALKVIDAMNDQTVKFLHKDRPLEEQKATALKKSVGLFFRYFGVLFKHAGKKSKDAAKNQKVVDFSSDAAKYFELKKLGKNTEAEVYKERMRRFLEGE